MKKQQGSKKKSGYLEFKKTKTSMKGKNNEKI
jgi:hypothetical protein